MMKHEFEKLVGFGVSPEDYAAVEREYMELPEELNIFKDRFCKLWLEASFGDTKRSVANYLLVDFYNKNKLLQKDVKFYKDLLHEAVSLYTDVKLEELEGGTA